VINIAGSFIINFEKLTILLKEELKEGEVRSKIRIIGEEINFDNEKIVIYISSYHPERPPDSLNREEYLFDCNFNGSIEECEEFLISLGNGVASHSGEALFEYGVVNEKGQNIDLEYKILFPGKKKTLIYDHRIA
jgi:hypothetical protein